MAFFELLSPVQYCEVGLSCRCMEHAYIGSHTERPDVRCFRESGRRDKFWRPVCQCPFRRTGHFGNRKAVMPKAGGTEVADESRAFRINDDVILIWMS